MMIDSRFNRTEFPEYTLYEIPIDSYLDHYKVDPHMDRNRTFINAGKTLRVRKIVLIDNQTGNISPEIILQPGQSLRFYLDEDYLIESYEIS